MAIPYDDINYLNIFPYVGKAANIEFLSLELTGGNLQTGQYTFYLRYLDEFSTPTNFFAASAPFAVPTSRRGVRQGTGQDGEESTSQAIRMRVTNIDRNYDRIQIAVVPRYNGTIGTPTLLPPKVITGSTMEVLYSGDNQGIPSSLEEILINTASYDTAKTLTQLDDTLYMGNLKRHKPLDYQKFANNIRVKAVERKYETDFQYDPYTESIDGMKSSGIDEPSSLAYFSKGFKRGEVYALYISFLLDDGRESPAYHIPGRAPTSFGYMGDTYQEDALLPDSQQTLRAVAGNGSIAAGEKARWFQFLSRPHPTFNTGYWENKDERYPTTTDWDIWDVDSNGNPLFTGQTLRGLNVRHHKMPDAEDVPVFTNPAVDQSRSVLGIELSNIKIPTEFRNRIRSVKLHYAKKSLNNQLIIDQSTNLPVEYDTDDDVLTPSPSLDEGPSTHTLQLHPFNSMRLKQNIEGLSYLRVSAVANVHTRTGIATSGLVHKAFGDGYGPWVANVPDKDRFRRVSAKTYIESYSFNEEGIANSIVRTSDAGFDFDFDNTNNSEFVLARISSLEHGNAYGTDGEKPPAYLIELCQYKENLFLEFDSQELVFTGVHSTNIDSFYPPAISEGESERAAGSITITSHAPPEDGGVQAQTELIGVTGTAEASFIFEIQLLGGANALVLIANGDDSITIVDKIEEHINVTNPELYEFEVNRTAVDTFRLRLKAVGDLVRTFILVTDEVKAWPHAGVDISTDEVLNTSGGEDPAVGQAGTLSFTLPNGAVISYNYEYGDLKIDIAQGLVDAFASVPDYNATLVSAADPRIDIEAEHPGTIYNGTITELENTDNLTYTIVNLTGGIGALEPFSLLSFGGDTFIGLHFTRHSRWRDEADDVESTIRSIMIESYAYPRYRSPGIQPWEQWAPGTTVTNTYAAIIWKDGRPNLTNKEGDIFPADPIRYNVDYLMNESVKRSLPFPKRRSEVIDLSTRIIRSRQDTVVEDVDLFRQFREEDYLDLPRNRGVLHKLSNVNNLLIPHMTRAIFRTRGREELSTGDFRAFLGSGDIFEIKPEEIYEKDLGHAGLQQTYASVVTEFGYFFVDQQARKVYHLTTEGLQDLANLGLSNFLENALKFNFEDQGFRQTDIMSPYFGILVGWDPYHERYLLTKKDLKIIWNPDSSPSPSPSPSPGPQQQLEFDTATQRFIDPENENLRLDWDDETYFAQDNFTLCFYPKINVWGSFHDYYPELYLFNTSEFYNIFREGLYHHQGLVHGRFYDTLYSAVLEYIDNRNPQVSNTVAGVFIDSELRTPDGVSVRDKTVTRLRVRNSYQDTGELPVTFFLNSGNARYANGFWRINQLRNLMDSQGELIEDREWYEKEWLSDRYHYVKLEYDNADNNKLYLLSSQLNFKESLR